MMRRCSAGTDGQLTKSAVPVRANIDEMWQHLRHLGPSNRANNPKNTRSTTVKIKQGHSHAGHQNLLEPVTAAISGRSNNEGHSDDDVDAGETTPLLVNGGSTAQTNSRPASQGYGTPSINATGPDAGLSDAHDVDSPLTGTPDFLVDEAVVGSSESESSKRNGIQNLSFMLERGIKSVTGEGAVQSSSGRSSSQSASSAAASDVNTPPSRRSIVRSGSITENVIETRGIRKVVLETSSTAEDDEEGTQVMASSSYVVRHTPSSVPQSPEMHIMGATEKEEDTVKRKDLETAFLSALQSETSAENAASALAPEVTSSGGQPDCVPADDSDTPATANGGGSGAKKKNRRKKRKAAK